MRVRDTGKENYNYSRGKPQEPASQAVKQTDEKASFNVDVVGRAKGSNEEINILITTHLTCDYALQ